jgi:competence protein ComEC
MGHQITVVLNFIQRGAISTTTGHLIQLYTATIPDLEVGDRVKIENIFIKKPNNENFWRYLMKEGILTTLFVQKLEFTVEHRPTFSIRKWFLTYKNNLLSRFRQQLSPATFHLFASLFLGVKNKKALETVNKQFKYWGILHYLARSGLHLAVVITIYETAFRFIPLPFMVQHFLLLLLGILYYFLSWSSISFIRAFIMFLYYKLSILAQIPTHFLHILLATCYIILLTNPIQLFFLDFQLSFCLTFALGWLNLYRTDKNTIN